MNLRSPEIMLEIAEKLLANRSLKISYEEGKFCWNNDRRLKGGQYCRTHQAGF